MGFPCTVGVYKVDRAYGGPEEGGWWFEVGELYAPVEPVVCQSHEEVEVACARCRLHISVNRLNDGRRHPASVLSDGWFEPKIINGTTAPEHFPQERPRYE